MSVFPEFSIPFNDLDDADFNLAIYELQNGPVRYDADRLASLSFNPFLHNIRTNMVHSFDLAPDPDTNFLFPWKPTLFQSPLARYRYFNDFKLGKH